MIVSDSGSTRNLCKNADNLMEVAGNFVSALECSKFAEGFNAKAFTYSDTPVDWDQDSFFGDLKGVNMPCLVYSECFEWEEVEGGTGGPFVSGDSFTLASWSSTQ
eukprot:scaffold630508_cov47-Prasinocladus_malaysianus.AAC.1